MLSAARERSRRYRKDVKRWATPGSVSELPSVCASSEGLLNSDGPAVDVAPAHPALGEQFVVASARAGYVGNGPFMPGRFQERQLPWVGVSAGQDAR